MDYDFADELRGEGPMNIKEAGIIPAIIVGVIVAGTTVFLSNTSGRGDSTVAALAELKTQVVNLSEQIKELKGQPYVTRNEYQAGLATTENRISGLEKRVDVIAAGVERVEIKR